MRRRLERLKKSGLKKLSRSDEDARFLRRRGGFVLATRLRSPFPVTTSSWLSG